MTLDENTWKFFKEHLGYNDEEMALFKDNPRNADVIEKAVGLMQKTIVAEVVESHGCNSRHLVGDRIVMDGVGNLISKLSPKRICIFALNSLAGGVFALHELYYAGVDPNEIRFKRMGCFDVGIRCGGWGKCVFEIRMEDRGK